jgi:hypothetical protein
MSIVRWVFEDLGNFSFAVGLLMLAAISYCIVAALVWLALEVWAEDWMEERSLDIPTVAYCWLPILILAPYGLPVHWAVLLFESRCKGMTSGEQVFCGAVWLISVPLWLLREGVACGFGGVWIGGKVRTFARRRLRTLREDKDTPIPVARVHRDRSVSTYIDPDVLREDEKRQALLHAYRRTHKVRRR